MGGGVTKSFGVVLMQEFKVFAIVMEGGGAKSFHFLKGGGGRNKFYPVLRGGRKTFQTRNVPIL